MIKEEMEAPPELVIEVLRGLEMERRGLYEDAMESFIGALYVALMKNDETGASIMHLFLNRIMASWGKEILEVPDEMHHRLLRICTPYTTEENPESLASFLVGEWLFAHNRLDPAISHMTRSLAMSKSSYLRFSAGWLLVIMHRLKDEYEKAYGGCMELIQTASEMHNEELCLLVLINAIGILCKLGNFEEAKKKLQNLEEKANGLQMDEFPKAIVMSLGHYIASSAREPVSMDIFRKFCMPSKTEVVFERYLSGLKFPCVQRRYLCYIFLEDTKEVITYGICRGKRGQTTRTDGCFKIITAGENPYLEIWEDGNAKRVNVDAAIKHDLIVAIKQGIRMWNFGFKQESTKLLLCGLHIAIRENDERGASIIDDCLLQLKVSMWDRLTDPNDMYEKILVICKEFAVSEDPEALAAFYVGDFFTFHADNEQSLRSDIAIPWIRKSLNHAKSRHIKHSTNRLLSESFLGMDDYEQALDHSNEQIRIANEMQNQEYHFFALAHYGHILCRQGRFGEILKVLEKLEQFGKHEIFSATISALRSRIEWYVGNTNKATELAKAVDELNISILPNSNGFLKLYLSGEEAPYIQTIKNTMLWVEQLRAFSGNIRVQQELFERANDLVKAHNLDEAEFVVADLLRACRIEKQERSAVLFIVAKIVAEHHTEGGWLHETGMEMIESFFQGWEESKVSAKESVTIPGELGRHYANARQYECAVMSLEKAVTAFLKIEGQFSSYNTGRISYLESMGTYFKWLEHTLLNLNPPQVKRALICAERRRARDLIYQIQTKSRAYEYLEGMQEFDSSDDKAWNEIESVCITAGPKTAFLVYSTFEDWISYFLHAGDDPCFCRITRDDHFPLPRTADLPTDDPPYLLSFLFKKVIDPWKAKLRSLEIKNIILIPDRLHIVPFPALYDADDKQYLIQKYAISYSPSLRFYKHCELQRQKNLKCVQEKKIKGLVVAPYSNLKSAGKEAKDEGNLISAGKEAKHVMTILERVGYDVCMLQKGSATFEAVLEQFLLCDWVHIATHANVKNEPPYGQILLADPSGKQVLAGGQEEIPVNKIFLTMSQQMAKVYEKYEDKMFPDDVRNILEESTIEERYAITTDHIEAQENLIANVVVLSACTTGLGMLCGEGVLGLCRSLHITGVPTVVASLWNVDDKPTFKLMEAFYNNLGEGKELVFALQEAMIYMLEKKDDYGHMVHNWHDWAGFFMSGSNLGRL